MWLTLLLSAFDDAVVVQARRAGSHELARRLGVGWKKEPAKVIAPFNVQMLRALFGFLTRRDKAIEQIEGENELYISKSMQSFVQRRTYKLCSDQIEYLDGLSDELLSRSGHGKEHWMIPSSFLARTVLSIAAEDGLGLAGSFAYPPSIPYPSEEVLTLFLARFQTRTSMDRVLHWVLAEWEANDWGRMWMEVSLLFLPSILDWAEATHTDPTKFAYAEARDRSQAWHDQFVAKGFGFPALPTVVVARDEQGWTLERLTDRMDFAHEGTSMGHCVGGEPGGDGIAPGNGRYWQAHRDGRGVYFSLRDPARVPHATIEVLVPRKEEGEGWGPSIVQIQGPKDKELSIEVNDGLRDHERLTRMLGSIGLVFLDSAGSYRAKQGDPEDTNVGISAAAKDRLRLPVPRPISMERAERMRKGNSWESSPDVRVVAAASSLRKEREGGPVVPAVLDPKKVSAGTWKVIRAVQAEIDQWHRHVFSHMATNNVSFVSGVSLTPYERDPSVLVVLFPVYSGNSKGEIAMRVGPDGSIAWWALPLSHRDPMRSVKPTIGLSTLADAYLIASGTKIEDTPSLLPLYPDLSEGLRVKLLREPIPALIGQPRFEVIRSE